MLKNCTKCKKYVYGMVAHGLGHVWCACAPTQSQYWAQHSPSKIWYRWQFGRLGNKINLKPLNENGQNWMLNRVFLLQKQHDGRIKFDIFEKMFFTYREVKVWYLWRLVCHPPWDFSQSVYFLPKRHVPLPS